VNIHVDLVKNDYQHRRRILGARVYPLPDDVKVDPQNGEDWNATIRARAFQDPETGETLSPRENPVRFLAKLHEVVNNTYWFATGLHDDDLCPFADGKGAVPIDVPVGRKILTLPE